MQDIVGAKLGSEPGKVLDSKARILGRSPFADLPGESREALLAAGRVERLPRRQRVVEQGEQVRNLVLLDSGRIRLERQRGDRSLLLGYRGPGETVGECALGGGVASEHATVADDSEALVVPLASMRRLLTADVALRSAVMALLLERRRAMEARLEALLLEGVEARLVGFLLDAVTRWGQKHERGELIDAGFTHADIALVIGSTRETVTLLLGKLRRAELIDFDRRRLVIRDRDGLARRAAEP